MTNSFTCARCHKTFTTEQTHVRQWTIDKWWRMVAQTCSDCRLQAAGEPCQGAAHTTGHDTEHQAALLIAPRSGALRAQVLQLLREHPDGLTDDEGGAYLGGDRLTFGRRRNELATRGIVVDTGNRRAGPSGRKAIVWAAIG